MRKLLLKYEFVEGTKQLRKLELDFSGGPKPHINIEAYRMRYLLPLERSNIAG
jgi:hypothetical protein